MKKKSVLNQMTLRECKQFISAIMDNYAEKMPVSIQITHGGTTDSFELVPKNFKYKAHSIDLTVQEITPAEMETVIKPGLYIAKESFQMVDKMMINYYGLFIDPDKKRDLRYFDSENKCLEWLKKKIKTMNN